MLYQHLLMGNRPYFVGISRMTGFMEHRHPELELSYCTRGAYDIFIGKTLHHLKAGDLAIVGPMASHMFPTTGDHSCLALTVNAGPALLGEYFDPFTKAEIPSPVIHLSASSRHQPLKMLLDEIIHLRQNAADFSELTVKGNLYKAFGYILSHFVTEHGGTNAKRLRDVAKIEQALELIHANYPEPLTIESMAAITGYGKSNFCKVFKQITGDTFHSVLNRHRLENACLLLESSALSIDDIAHQVGLTDAKTFCRIFKAAYGLSPGAYRKNHA
ncbi:MAG: helix-turn-helix domain-containing protein [Clostridiales bacterium]|nr:helix-turn-helix domain-containing protein [Clostridiales bacterium]